MPKIAELKEFEGSVWARIDMPLGSPIQILSPDEIDENRQREMRNLDAIACARAALMSCESWIDRWTKHVGRCEGDNLCTCGRTAILYEARTALAHQQSGERK